MSEPAAGRCDYGNSSFGYQQGGWACCRRTDGAINDSGFILSEVDSVDK